MFLRRFLLLIILIISLAAGFTTPPYVYAADCRSMGITSTGLGETYSPGEISSLPVSVYIGGLDPVEYHLMISRAAAWRTLETEAQLPDANRNINFTITDPRAFNPVGSDFGSTTVATYLVSLASHGEYICSLGEYKISEERSCDNILIHQFRGGNECYGGSGSGGCLNDDDILMIQAVGVREGGNFYGGNIDIKVTGTGAPRDISNVPLDSSGNSGALQYGVVRQGRFDVIVQKAGISGSNFCTTSFTIENNCATCQEEKPVSTPDGEISSTPFYLCDQLPDGSQAKIDCIKCATGNPGATEEGEGDREGIWTAVGCIKRSPKDIIGTLMRLGLTMGGGVALLMILGSGFILSTSAGDPKRTGEAKEMMVAAITGLIFVIFSVAILQFIGFSVLQIPGFGGN